MNKTAILLAFSAALLAASCSKSSSSNTVTPTVSYPYSFDDEFNADTNGWIYADSYNDTYVSIITGGYLHYIYHPGVIMKNTVTVDPAYDTKHDFALTTSVQSDNAMGLAFGVSSTSYGYSFEIDNNGNYGLFNLGDSLHGRTTILNWASTPAASPGNFNKLELDQIAGEWYGYVNGNQVFTVTARPLSGSRVGFAVETNTNGNADYLNVKWD